MNRHGISDENQIIQRERRRRVGIITNDAYGIEDPQLYELLLEKFGNGMFGKKLRDEALAEVKELTIVNTQISDLSFLRFFPALVQLDVHSNALMSLMGLGFVPQLRRLKICDNPLFKITSLILRGILPQG